MSSQQASSRLSGTRKVAVLLAVLGEEAAAAILRQLGEKEIQAISEELVTLESVPPELANEVLEEFYRTAGPDAPKAWGGPGYVKGLLTKTFGEEAGSAVLRRIAQAEEAGGAQFRWMQSVDPKQIAKFLEDE